MEETQTIEAIPADVARAPTEDELPSDDGIPMETQRHVLQLQLLMDPLLLHWAERQDVFVGGNMFVYFSPEQVRNRDFRGPDFFVVLNVPRREHKSWVVWQEGKGPDVVIELLSESTAAMDKGEKKQIYQECLRVPEYFWFDPFSAELAGFALQEGVYQPLVPDAQERLVSQRVGLALVRWEGAYQGVSARWLRWATLEGPLLPTGPELAEREHQQSVAAQAQAAAAQAHAAAAQEQAAVARQHAAELETLLARYRERFGELLE
jgi:Uma2 family endonuclease